MPEKSLEQLCAERSTDQAIALIAVELTKLKLDWVTSSGMMQKLYEASDNHNERIAEQGKAIKKVQTKINTLGGENNES